MKGRPNKAIAVCKSHRKRQEKHNITNTLHTHTHTHTHTHARTYALMRKCNEHNFYSCSKEEPRRPAVTYKEYPTSDARGEHVFTRRLSLRHLEFQTGRISTAKTPNWWRETIARCITRIMLRVQFSCTSTGFGPLGIPVPGSHRTMATVAILSRESWDSGTIFS